MKDKIYPSFEEWLAEHNELINLHFGGASQRVVNLLRSAWSARNAEIQELKDKVEKCKLSLLNCEKYIDKEFYKIMDTYTKCAHTNFILDNINSSVRDDLKKTLKELKELGERE